MKFGEDDYVMDSRKIATRLEHDYPSPSMHLESPLLAKVEELTPRIWVPVRAVWLPLVPDLLNESSAEYFERTRKQSFGMSLSELKQKEGQDGAWVKVMPALKELGDLMEKEGGPYLMGQTGE